MATINNFCQKKALLYTLIIVCHCLHINLVSTKPSTFIFLSPSRMPQTEPLMIEGAETSILL